jgi:hypothetical protein
MDHEASVSLGVSFARPIPTAVSLLDLAPEKLREFFLVVTPKGHWCACLYNNSAINTNIIGIARVRLFEKR